jgi:hypothetical protein
MTRCLSVGADRFPGITEVLDAVEGEEVRVVPAFGLPPPVLEGGADDEDDVIAIDLHVGVVETMESAEGAVEDTLF